MTSLILLGILLTSGLMVPDGVVAAPSLGYNDGRGNLLDALKFIEMKALEEEQQQEELYDDYVEDVEDYDNYIRENWPEESPEIQLQSGPPIEEPPYYTNDWPEVEKLPLGPAYPVEYSQSELDNEVVKGLHEESELESEEVLDLSEISEGTLEDILKDVMAEELLKEYEEVEDEIDDEQSVESEVEEEEVIVRESVLDEDDDEIEDEVMADEEAAILDRLTEEIAAEVEDEVAEEIDKLTKETVNELAEEIAEEILGELKDGELEPEDIALEESDAEEDAEEGLKEYFDQLEEMEIKAAEEEEDEDDNQTADKRDGEYPFGAWEDETIDETDENEVEDAGLGTETEVANEEDEDEQSDEVNWEALQYLYGPYLEKLRQEYFENNDEGEIENEGFNEIVDNRESVAAAEEDEEMRYPEYTDESEEIAEEEYDYSQDEDEALNEVLYEEAVEEAIKEIEDEAAEAAKELVDEMLIELVEEERRKEMLEQQQMKEYENEQEPDCSVLDYMVDDCQVVELYEGLGDGGYREAFAGPCNRHQLCYTCASIYGVSVKTCDDIFLNEMFDVCDGATSGSGSCEVHAGYFLKAAKNSREIPEPNSYLDYVCRSECVYNALLQ